MKFEYHVKQPAAMLRAATRNIRSPRFPRPRRWLLRVIR